MVGEPREAVNGEVLAPGFEPGDVAHAHAEPLRERLPGPPSLGAELHEPQADVPQELVGILALHRREEHAPRLAKR